VEERGGLADELDGDSVEPKVAPTLGTFLLLSCDLAMFPIIDQVADLLCSMVDI
jgi:hypothetical protein